MKEKDKERVNAHQAESMRLLRSDLTSQDETLSRMKAKHGMRLCKSLAILEYTSKENQEPVMMLSDIVNIGPERMDFHELFLMRGCRG